jgi:hypothetical protein
MKKMAKCHYISKQKSKTAYQNTSTRKMKNKQVITKNYFFVILVCHEYGHVWVEEI